MRTFTTFGTFFLLFGWSFSSNAQLIINEVGAFGGVEDAAGLDEDWIELRNIGGSALPIAGFHLSDDQGDWLKWSFPLEEPDMEPGERRIVLASGRGGGVNHWDLIVQENDVFRYAYATPAASWRVAGFDDSDWAQGIGGFGFGDGDDATPLPPGTQAVYLRKEFTIANPDAVTFGLLSIDVDDGFIAYLNGRELKRSENMMESQPGIGWVQPTSDNEAVLYAGGTPQIHVLDLGPWLLPGSNTLAIEAHNINANSSDLTARPFLAAGFITGPNPGAPPLPDWLAPPPTKNHTNFKLKAGETIILSAPDGALVDALVLPDVLQEGMSVGRAAFNPSATCTFNSPSPGLANTGMCFSGIASTPQVLPASGRFDLGTVLLPTVNADEELTLRYTLDGSTPHENSDLVENLPALTESAVLTVRAFAENQLPSEAATRSYLITDESPIVPVVSISTAPDNLWDYNSGIYVLGPFASGDYPFLGANFWQPWSRYSRLEWFNAEGTAVAQTALDLEIHGGWSRAEPQKSFRLDFKDRYAGDLETEVFAQRPGLSEFGNLNLRNGGQGSWTNKIQDAFLADLALTELRVPASSWEPVELYLNGAYWGLYGAREKTDERWAEDVYGIPKEHVDMLNQWEPLAGPTSSFDVSVAPLLSMNPSTSEFESMFHDVFDVPAFIDYHIIQIHGQNVDWMSADWGVKNMKFFRNGRTAGPWRYVLFDMDGSFGAWETSPFMNSLQLALNPAMPSVHSDLLDAFLDNSHFRCGFATRYNDLLNSTFRPDHFSERLYNKASELSQIMPRHIERWNAPSSMNYWYERIDHLAGYNASRIDPSRDQLRGAFGWGPAKVVTTLWAPTAGGHVEVNELPGQIPSWSGEYFGECPITIAAFPAEGFGFNGWEPNAHSATGAIDVSQPFLQLELDQSDTFKANFSNCLGGVTLSIGQNNEGELVAVAVGLPAPGEFTWWQDGMAIATGTTCATWSGEETVFLTLSVGSCTLMASNIGTVNSIPDAPDLAQFAAHPNPAQNYFVLDGLTESMAGEIRLMSIGNGQVVQHHAHARLPKRIDATGLPSGTYAVQWVGVRGDMKVVKVVVMD